MFHRFCFMKKWNQPWMYLFIWSCLYKPSSQPMQEWKWLFKITWHCWCGDVLRKTVSLNLSEINITLQSSEVHDLQYCVYTAHCSCLLDKPYIWSLNKHKCWPTHQAAVGSVDTHSLNHYSTNTHTQPNVSWSVSVWLDGDSEDTSCTAAKRNKDACAVCVHVCVCLCVCSFVVKKTPKHLTSINCVLK